MNRPPRPSPARHAAVQLLLLIAAILSFAGSGCQKKPETATTGGKAKIVFWNTMGTLESEALPPLVNEFMIQNPEIQVVIEKVPFYESRSKFEQGLKAGVAPDVFRTDRFGLADFIRSGSLEEFAADAVKEEMEDLVTFARQVVTSEGKVWALPQSVDCLGLLYNKAHFKEAGVTPPEDYDMFRDAARKLTDAGKGRYGFFLNPDPWWFEPFLFAFGGRYFSPSGNFDLSSDQTLKAIQFLLDLKETEKAVPPVNLRSNAYDLMMQSFRNGQVSMILNGPWSIRVALDGPAFKDKSDNLGVTQLPKGPQGRFSPIGVQCLVIPKGCRNREAALRFIKFMCSKEVEATLSKTNFGIPARKSLFSDPELKNDPFLRPFIEQMQTGDASENRVQTARLYALVGEHLMKILNGDLAPKDGLKDLETSWKAKP